MLNFILLFTTLFSVRAMSDMEAKLQRRVEVLEATVKLLLERDAQREAAISADFAPRRLAEIKPIDRKGVTIKSDKAWLTMGKDSGIIYLVFAVSRGRFRVLLTYLTGAAHCYRF